MRYAVINAGMLKITLITLGGSGYLDHETLTLTLSQMA